MKQNKTEMTTENKFQWNYIYADGFSGVPRISPVLGLLRLVARRDPEEDDWDAIETSIRKPSFPGPDWYAGHPKNHRLYIHEYILNVIFICQKETLVIRCYNNIKHNTKTMPMAPR